MAIFLVVFLVALIFLNNMYKSGTIDIRSWTNSDQFAVAIHGFVLLFLGVVGWVGYKLSLRLLYRLSRNVDKLQNLTDNLTGAFERKPLDETPDHKKR